MKKGIVFAVLALAGFGLFAAAPILATNDESTIKASEIDQAKLTFFLDNLRQWKSYLENEDSKEVKIVIPEIENLYNKVNEEVNRLDVMSGPDSSSKTDEPKKDDTPSSDTPSSDGPSSDTPGSDTPSSDTPGSDEPKSDEPKSDESKSDKSKDDKSKTDKSKDDKSKTESKGDTPASGGPGE
jgi:hypothetical protein